MKKLSKEELDLALDKMKDLRGEDAYGDGDEMLGIFASCYEVCLPPFFLWDRAAGGHMCIGCGRPFGVNADGLDSAYTNCTEVCKQDFEDIMEAFETCKRAGYDAEIEMRCSECVEERGFDPMAFKFRAPGEEKYTVSYPHMESNIERYRLLDELPSDKHFFPWQYSVAASFVTDLYAKGGNTTPEEACRAWLHTVSWGKRYDGLCWNDAYRAIEGILGLSLGGPPQ